jgi:protein-S-isoprenylcysteine O-methyltransferase Ste14
MNSHTAVINGITPVARTQWVWHLGVLGVVVAAILAMFQYEVINAVQVWWIYATYSHCFLILPIFAWLIWEKRHELATTGAYAYLRHPQYAGFILIMLGFLLQWPTVLTLAMFPILVGMYVRLAHREEREARAEFGEAYARYAATTPAFVPRLRRGTPRPA